MRRHCWLAAAASFWAKAVAHPMARAPWGPRWRCRPSHPAAALAGMCQVAVKIFETAALIPSSASEITSLTPSKARRPLIRSLEEARPAGRVGNLAVEKRVDALPHPKAARRLGAPGVDVLAEPGDLAL